MHPLCYNHANSKPSTSLCTAGVSSDYLGLYLFVLQQDQAELGPALCKVQTSCVYRHGLALYTLTVSIKGTGGDQSTPQPILPKVVPRWAVRLKKALWLRSSPLICSHQHSGTFWNTLRSLLVEAYTDGI